MVKLHPDKFMQKSQEERSYSSVFLFYFIFRYKQLMIRLHPDKFMQKSQEECTEKVRAKKKRLKAQWSTPATTR
jgi:hypothetical protein